MNSQLTHIFDNSACLTKRQLKGYVDGSMTNEESHAVEVHLNSCPFCNAAVEGLFAQKEGDLLAVDALNELNTDFLKDHFSLTNPQIHLNSIAPAAQQVHTIGREKKRKSKSQPLVRITSIAAALALVFGVLWFFDYSSNKLSQNKLAQQATVSGAADAENATPKSNNSNTTASVTSSDETVLAAGTQAAPAQQPVTTDLHPATPAGEPLPESQRPQTLLLTSGDDKAAKEEKPAVIKDAQPDQPAPTVAGNTADVTPMERKAADDSKMSLAAAKTPAVVLTESVRRQESTEDLDPLEEAHKLYAQKKYSKALPSFKKEMNNGSTARRQEASIMAAKCYINLGENNKAEELLNDIIEQGGPQKKAAKKLLRDITPED